MGAFDPQLVQQMIRLLSAIKNNTGCDDQTAGAGTKSTFSATSGIQILGRGFGSTGILDFTGQPLDTQTVVIGSKTYTFQTVLTDVDGNVFIGAAATDSLDNLIAAINTDAGVGTLYAASMTVNEDVSALAGAGDTMDVTALVVGVAGDLIATTETLTNGSWTSGATLGGGLDGDSDSYTYLATLELRGVEVWTRTETSYQITITKSDASSIIWNIMAPGYWRYSGETNEAEITAIDIVNTGASNTAYSINLVSKQ